MWNPNPYAPQIKSSGFLVYVLTGEVYFWIDRNFIPYLQKLGFHITWNVNKWVAEMTPNQLNIYTGWNTDQVGDNNEN